MDRREKADATSSTLRLSLVLVLRLVVSDAFLSKVSDEGADDDDDDEGV